MATSTTGGRPRRLTALGAVALLVALAGACASEADPDDYADLMTDAGDREGGAGDTRARALAQASEQSASEAYRVTASLRINAAFDGEPEMAIDSELASGEVDGDRRAMHMDLGRFMDGLAGPVSDMPGSDASLDMVGDREVVYMRGSGLGELADVIGDEAGAEWMRELGDRWGRVDLGEFEGASAGVLTGALGAGGSPQDTLAALAGATDAAQTEDIGSDEIDGMTVHGTRFTLPLSEVLGDAAATGMSEGVDPDETSPEELQAFDDVAVAFLGSDVPVEAWVDDDGYVRRIGYEIDMGAILAEEFGDLAEAAGEPLPTMTMGSTMDFTDYGDPGISIEFPDDADTVDVTDTFADMLAGD